MMYNELVESYFFAPNHVGIVDLSQPLSLHYSEGVAGRGDVFDFYLLCNSHGFVLQARFKAYGNPYLIAAAEWLCRQLEGSLINEHPRFNYSCLVQDLAIPKTRYSVALQIEDGYREIVTMMQKKLYCARPQS
jgi:nitrogen fixation protein NifU and related proteins